MVGGWAHYNMLANRTVGWCLFLGILWIPRIVFFRVLPALSCGRHVSVLFLLRMTRPRLMLPVFCLYICAALFSRLFYIVVWKTTCTIFLHML